MARVRTHRRSLADVIDLDDLDGSVEDLLDMNEQEFTRAVLLYLEGDRLGLEVMRDPEVIERTYDTIDRLLHSYRRRRNEGEHSGELSRLIESLDAERKAIRIEALAARDARVRKQQVARTSRVNDRLERALAKQQALREEIMRAQRKTPEARALERLRKAHEPEFLRYKREEREWDRREAAAREGAAEPAGESAAPSVPNQSART